MGLSLFKSCGCAKPGVPAPAPNPDPKRWLVLKNYERARGYVLVVRYLDCTNFEGVKVMVYRGSFSGYPSRLDPHFTRDESSPIARFRPDEEGIAMAIKLAESL